jgi:hypothetical protein
MTHSSPDRVSSNRPTPIEVEARTLDYVRNLLSKSPGCDRFELAPIAQAVGTTSRTVENIVRAASAAFEEGSPYGYVRSSRSDDLDDCWLARRSRRIYRTPAYPRTAYKGFRAIFPQEYACQVEHWLYVAYTRSRFAERGVPLEVLRRAAIGPSPSEKARERFKGWLTDARSSGRVLVAEGDLARLGDPMVAIIEGWIEELSRSNAPIEKNTTEGFDCSADHWHSGLHAAGCDSSGRAIPVGPYVGNDGDNDDDEKQQEEGLDSSRSYPSQVHKEGPHRMPDKVGGSATTRNKPPKEVVFSEEADGPETNPKPLVIQEPLRESKVQPLPTSGGCEDGLVQESELETSLSTTVEELKKTAPSLREDAEFSLSTSETPASPLPEQANSLSTMVEELKKTAPSVRGDADSSFLPSEKTGDPFVTNLRAPGDPLSANTEESGDPSPAFSGRSPGDLLSAIPGGIIEEPYRTAPFGVSSKQKVKPLSKAEVKLRNRLDLVLQGTTEGRRILNRFLDEFPKALTQHGKPWSVRRVLSFLLTGRSDSTITIGGELREQGVRLLNILKDKGLLCFRKLVASDGCYRKNDGNRYYLPQKS